MTASIALVTGASRGLGAAMAEELITRGWNVIALARTIGGLEELDDRIKALKQPGAGQLTLAPIDLTDDNAIAHICRSIHDRWGHLDLWVHSAIHAAPMAPAAYLDVKDWDKSVAINIRATGVLIPMIEPLLQAAPNARVLFLNDPKAGDKFFGAYGASKAAQMALAQSWQVESQKHGPHVHIETPNPMPTATRARFHPGEDRTLLTPVRDEARRILDKVLL